MIRIIHLTDFHLNPKNRKDWKNYVKETMLEKLKLLHEGNPISLIAFTGDMIDQGGKHYSSCEEAFNLFKREVLNEILNELDLTIDRFLITPGNHDIQRSKDELPIELGYQKYFSIDYGNVSKFMDEVMSKNKFIGVERMINFVNFEKELYQSVPMASISFFESSFRIKVEGITLGISCFNSVWRSYGDKDKGLLLLGEEQIVRSQRHISDCEIKVALVHHPLDWLSSQEQKTISDHLNKDYNVLLTGHVHEGATSMKTDLMGTLFINIAPSGLNDIRSDSRSFANGFTVVDFEKDFNEVNCTFYRYNHSQKKFVLNTDLVEYGELNFQVPQKKSKKELQLIDDVLNNIREDHFQNMDEHLISSKAPKGPCNIKDAFILPPIDQGIHSTDEVDPTVQSISTIAKSSRDLMFFGAPESGKTILLYRLVREFIDEYGFLGKVPVYIDFEDIGNKRIETKIREYLRCSSRDVDYLLSENKLVLLIDNLNFRKDYNRDNINKLNRFKSADKFEGIRIIAAGEDELAGIPLTYYIDLCKIPFKNYFIKDLKSSQIKKLVKKWQPVEYEKEPNNFIDKMINNFHSYSLPSTAMSVSLYLWSLENKDRKPINHAVLLEIYIEIVLEKLAKKNIYREKFDFTNKMQLLAMIAHEMYALNQTNYSVSYSEYLKIIVLTPE